MDAKLKTLSEMPYGKRATVAELLHDEETRIRLLELGFLPGVEVWAVRGGPLGCPVEVEVSGARFSLRRVVLDAILVMPRA